MAIAENICKLQAEHGESNYRLAKEIGVTCTSVQNWRTGVTKPLHVYAEKIAAHYGVTVDDLLKEETQ